MYTDTLSEHCWKINPNIYLVSRYHIILWERKLWNIWAVCDEKCFLCKQSITWLQIMRGQDWAEAWSWLWFELSEARLHPASCNVGGVRDALTEKIAMIRDKWKYNRCSWKVVNIRSSQFSWILYILDVGLNSFLEAGVDLTTNIWYRCLVVQESQIDIIYFYNKLSYKCNISTSYIHCFH